MTEIRCTNCGTEEVHCYKTGLEVRSDKFHYLCDAFICTQCNRIFFTGFCCGEDNFPMYVKGRTECPFYYNAEDIHFMEDIDRVYLCTTSGAWSHAFIRWNQEWYPTYKLDQQFEEASK